MEITNKTASLEARSIFTLFFLALFVSYGTLLGAVMGAICGMTVSLLIAFWDVLTRKPIIRFQSIGLSGFTADVLVACLFSKFGPHRDNLRAKKFENLHLTQVAGDHYWRSEVILPWFTAKLRHLAESRD